MDTATWLVLDGFLLGGLVALRTVCAHVVDLDSVPRCIRGRIELGNRVAPWLAAIAVALVAVGVVITISPP